MSNTYTFSLSLTLEEITKVRVAITDKNIVNKLDKAIEESVGAKEKSIIASLCQSLNGTSDEIPIRIGFRN